MLSRRHLLLAAPAFAARHTLQIATFSVDVTPPRGSALCYALVVPSERVEAPLLAKGVVLYPSGDKPIVLCAVDWLGIGGESYKDWQVRLAKAARTTPDRVAVHTVHQHDAPGDSRGAARLVEPGLLTPVEFCAAAVGRVADAIAAAKPVAVSHWATSQATVNQVASNRRILAADGRSLAFQRMSKCAGSEYCDAPEGVIDPQLKTLSFYSSDRLLAALHYYATHPMSYYGKGVVNPDFVGIARESMTGFHVYFTGAAGNVAPGKYNNGEPATRLALADRISTAMKASLAAAKPVAVSRVGWRTVAVRLPHREGAEFSEAAIRKALADTKLLPRERASAARYLEWWQACQSKSPNITLQTLQLDGASILHMPGELFIEYQLAAQREKPNQWTTMAAYGEYGPMYIGTAAAYPQKGYETGPVSRVGPNAEPVLLEAIKLSLR